MIRVLALVALVAIIHQRPILAAPVALAAFLVFSVGYRAAVRKSGVGMIRGGAHRVKTGRF